MDHILKKLDFERKNGRHFIHPSSVYFVEFPGSTLAIGSSLDTEVVERKSKLGVLKLLSPTDCVKDRLAAYYHWNDLQGLEQALLVAKNHPVKIQKIKSWSKDENNLEKYQIFLKKLKNK